MTALTQEILKTFDGLSDIEKREVALEIMRRLANTEIPPLTDEDLVLNADSIFLELDRQEAVDENA